MKNISKNKFKILFFWIFALSIVLFLNNASYGVDFSQVDGFLEHGRDNPAIDDLSQIGTEFSELGNLLRYVGAGIMVGAMGYMGILYMVSSPEKQAKLKQQLIGLVVAGVVIFGGYFIWETIVDLFTSVGL